MSAVWVVLPAAGQGSRFGSERAKQFAPFRGVELWAYSLNRLLCHPSVSGAVVALPASELERPFRPIGNKPVLRCPGGNTRAASVAAALCELHRSGIAADWVLVHDAARPCLRRVDLDALLDRCGTAVAGAILATPVIDTLKRAEHECVLGTVPRSDLWRALTPQLMRREWLMGALAQAQERGIEVTDEAMALELIGATVQVVAGHADNIKITHASDLAWAEYICGQIEQEEARA